MKILAGDLAYLTAAIEQARLSDFTEINKIFSELFGERVSKRSAEALLSRAVASGGQQSRYEKGTGAVVLAGAAVAPAIVRALAAEPRHNFHCEALKKDK